ncbi:hypothetical protein [uncultured Shewanella sp.]|uniref:hypothetical protein n=1 Tax=uncultured Shewanella sp. TaxID=173975 RepID=UPI0026384D93|nr:hypothetical protein [uncultured Shewanella sp.]
MLMTLTWVGVSLSSLLIPDNMMPSMIKGAGMVHSFSKTKSAEKNAEAEVVIEQFILQEGVNLDR